MQTGIWIGMIMLMGLAVAAELWNTGRNEKRRKERLKRSYGCGRTEAVPEPERLKMIDIYNRMIQEWQPDVDWVDEVTWRDLDMDKIFAGLNHTVSFAGEQFLYSELHRLSEIDAEDNRKELVQREERIQFFAGHPEARERAWHLLLPLKKEAVNYYIPEYVTLLEMQRFPLLKLCRVLRISLLALTAAAILTAHPLLIGAAVLNLLVNISIYAVEKVKYEVFLSTMSGLVQMIHAARGLLDMNEIPENEKLSDCLKGLDKISHRMLVLERKKKAGMTGDFMGLVADYLIGALMWDFIAYDRIVRLLEGRSEELMAVYRFVGEADMDIAVASWRESLGKYCVPEVGASRLVMEGIYYPLMKRAVENDLEMKKNILITGSNASGKSTFIKSVAVNLILGQTVHTCTAKSMEMPKLLVFTSMAVRDDIVNGESYYIKEICYLRRMVAKSGGKRLVFFGIDEILRGTNTAERLAASIAILKYFRQKGSLVMVASHDLELAQALEEDYENYYFCDKIENKDVVFDYRLRRGICCTRNAIRLLASMGFPGEILDEAKRRCL